MKIKKIINQITIPMLCISMEFGNVVPVYAAIIENDTSTFEEAEKSTSKETEVIYQKSASYFVTIPKTISLGSDKQSPYAVKVEGDIPSDKQVYVSPIDDISDTDALDFYMHDQNTKAPKDDVAATVMQSKFYWNFEDVQNAYEETDNHVTAEALTSGTWKGTFDFEINMHSMESDRLILTTDGDVTMGADSTYQTNAYINGKEVNDAVEWASDNEDIQVADGLLETKASAQVGDTAKITVTAENSPSAYSLEDVAETDMLSADFNVTVIDIAFIKEETGETVSSLDIQPGKSGSIQAAIIPETVEGTVKWSTTATAGLNLVPNGNMITIKAAEDMPTGRTYDVIATYGTYSKILTVNIVSDHEHNYVSEITKEATYTEAGEKTITCTICNESHKEEIPMLKDSTAPTGSVTVSDNKWENFLNTITFDIFFRETQDVVIEADDKESGIKEVSYHLAVEQVEKDSLSALEWTEYNGKLTISPNEKYVIYVKITDNQDNVTYINSDGIVLDNIAPTIEGAEDGGTYEPDTTITIGDDETLKVNGEKVEVIDNSYTFGEEGEYTISASDRAGNETSITITIQHTHNYVDNICTECGKRDPESIHYVTLRSADTSSASFFGNSDIVKADIINVSFLTSSEGHYLSDDNCWDVSDAQDGSILAWYTYNSLNDYYHVYFAPKNEGDIIRAPQNATGLLSGMKKTNQTTTVTINGLNTVDFSQTTNFTRMFAGTKLYTLNFDVDTSSAEYMDEMFYDCSQVLTGTSTTHGLLNITFSDKVKTPNLKSANRMFSTVTLKNIYNVETMLSSINSISRGMFFYCPELKDIIIPDNIETIGDNAFSGCSNLTRLEIPDSVETIGENAFYNVPLVVLPCSFEGSAFGAKSVEIRHDYIEEIVKEAACTEMGEIKYTCSGCGDSYTKSTPMKGHSYENKITKEPTCTETGEKTFTCKNCGYSFKVSVKKLDHAYEGTIIKEATCTEEGEMSYICNMCGDSYNEAIPTIEHNYDEDGFCTECGNEYPYYTAPENAYTNWNYTLDEMDQVITLNYYTGSETDVIVYGNYVIGGTRYKTQIADNIKSAGISNNYMFNGNAQKNCQNIKTIIFCDHIDTSNITNMNYMFYNCTSLTSLDLSSFNTSNVTNMNWMLCNCSSLTDLDLSSFDTSNITNMSYMFKGCSALRNLDLSSFDTGKVTNMSHMFDSCTSLTSLNLSSFDTGNATDMSWMFYYCSSLTSLDLSKFDTSKVTNMNYMFNLCRNLKTIYAVRSKWTTAKATTTSMFTSCGTSSVTYR